MISQRSRRASFIIIFGEGDERWSFPDPGHDIVDEAQACIRYDDAASLQQVKSAGLILADTVSALHYLLYTCPTTKLACEKLAAVRRALATLPDEAAPMPRASGVC